MIGRDQAAADDLLFSNFSLALLSCMYVKLWFGLLIVALPNDNIAVDTCLFLLAIAHLVLNHYFLGSSL